MSTTLQSIVTEDAEIRRVADELFITTDLKDWAAARSLFAGGTIEVDMSEGFRSGLHAGKVSHHLAANYRIEVDGDQAELWAHGYAWNRVAALGPGKELWETWGNYRLSYRRTGGQWYLTGFRYYSKLTRGNDAVRTHTG